MNINQRIKNLRKSIALNQKEFADKIGLTQTALSRMEKDGGTVIDQNVALISSIFNVSETWLRTGNGEIFLPKSRHDEITAWAENLSAITGNSFPQRLALTLSRLNDTQWEILESIVDSIAAEPDTTSQEIERAKAHALLDQELDAEQEAAQASHSTASDKKRA